MENGTTNKSSCKFIPSHHRHTNCELHSNVDDTINKTRMNNITPKTSRNFLKIGLTMFSMPTVLKRQQLILFNNKINSSRIRISRNVKLKQRFLLWFFLFQQKPSTIVHSKCKFLDMAQLIVLLVSTGFSLSAQQQQLQRFQLLGVSLVFALILPELQTFLSSRTKKKKTKVLHKQEDISGTLRNFVCLLYSKSFISVFAVFVKQMLYQRKFLQRQKHRVIF